MCAYMNVYMCVCMYACVCMCCIHVCRRVYEFGRRRVIKMEGQYMKLSKIFFFGFVFGWLLLWFFCFVLFWVL